MVFSMPGAALKAWCCNQIASSPSGLDVPSGSLCSEIHWVIRRSRSYVQDPRVIVEVVDSFLLQGLMETGTQSRRRSWPRHDSVWWVSALCWLVAYKILNGGSRGLTLT